LYYMPSPSHPHWLDHLIILAKEQKLWSLSLYSFFFQPPITAALFNPDILLSTRFSNTHTVFLP
jgi:hypothetical protein